MRARWAGLLAVLLVATPALATESDRLLEAEGQLLAGTAGVGLGAPSEAVPANVSLGIGPVSHVAHPFAVDCARGVSAEVTWTSLGNATLDVPEHALLQVELRTPDGEVLADTFDDDGDAYVGTEGQLDPGTYELHLFHLAGETVDYVALVDGLGSMHC